MREKQGDRIVLRAKSGYPNHRFSPEEGYALRYFNGKYTVAEVRSRCQQEFDRPIPENFVVELLEKLVRLNILAPESATDTETRRDRPSPELKPCLEWIWNPNGHWILRNPENCTHMQVSDRDKQAISQLDRASPQQICQQFGLSLGELKRLTQYLAATGMLVGTEPVKPKRGKFTPLSLLFFRIPLFNPDPFLNRHIDRLRWIWSRPFALFLIAFLALCTAVGLSDRAAIVNVGEKLFSTYGASLLLPFGLLVAFVVTLHEFGHAFTLKHYGGIVPEMGFLLIIMMPAAYTNTSDSYCLSRFKRVQVVGAGVMVQLIIAAIALCLWHWSLDGSWLHTASYLLMVAALFTVALNLNPLARFDGYYLAVALTGINNLRRRAFGLYAKLLTGRPLQERSQDIPILAFYAPFSLAYIWFVFGFLFWRITDFSLTHIPITALIILVAWLIYYFFPSKQPQ